MRGLGAGGARRSRKWRSSRGAWRGRGGGGRGWESSGRRGDPRAGAKVRPPRDPGPTRAFVGWTLGGAGRSGQRPHIGGRRWGFGPCEASCPARSGRVLPVAARAASPARGPGTTGGSSSLSARVLRVPGVRRVRRTLSHRLGDASRTRSVVAHRERKQKSPFRFCLKV